MNWDIKYGELTTDQDFVKKCENLKTNYLEMHKVLDHCLHLKKDYEKLPLNAQIELDLFLAFTLNALQWIHLRIQGIDPTKHPILNEIQRIKKIMLRWKEVKDQEKRPKVDKDAAKRFIKSGLYDPKTLGQPVNKKIKFVDVDNNGKQ